MGDLDRSVLPMPDRKSMADAPLDARDAHFPPIEPLRPPAGAPNVLIVLLDDVGFAASSAFGGPCNTPTAERLAGERPPVQPLPHDRPVRAHPRRPAVGPQPPHRRHGRHHRAGHVGARLQLPAPQRLRAAGADAPPQRLRDRPVRQVPRGPGLADQPAGPVRRLAQRRRRLRALLRLHRRRDQPVLPGDLRRHDPRRAAEDARAGLPLRRGHDRSGRRLGPPAAGADAGQAVLHVLRAGRHPRAAPRPRRRSATATRAGSTRAGTGCGRRSSRARSPSA